VFNTWPRGGDDDDDDDLDDDEEEDDGDLENEARMGIG
jgi:hypothetical protein